MYNDQCLLSIGFEWEYLWGESNHVIIMVLTNILLTMQLWWYILWPLHQNLLFATFKKRCLYLLQRSRVCCEMRCCRRVLRYANVPRPLEKALKERCLLFFAMFGECCKRLFNQRSAIVVNNFLAMFGECCKRLFATFSERC